MEWFGGNVMEAIQKAKMNQSVFIVHIYGDDVASREMTETWNDENVRLFMSSNNCVAIRLEANSQSGRQFSQIYPVMCVPSVFFINGSNGIPLEVCGGSLSPAQLVDKFRHAIQLHSSQIPTSNLSTTSPQPATSSVETASSSCERAASPFSTRAALVDTSCLANDESSSGACAAMTREPLCDTSDKAVSGDDVQSEIDESLARGTMEEKKERAAALLAEKRDKKLAEEKEKEKQEEVERRKLGQDMSKFKNWKDEMQRKEIETTLRKDKEEAKRARDRVREDIERDRQERAARFQKEKNEEKAVSQAKTDARSQAEAELQARKDAARRETARIQFRLPDGSSVTQPFPSSDSLSTARDFILHRLDVNSVMLVCTFPKRTFSEADMKASFLQLDLVPSAALIVLVTSHAQVVKDGSVGGFMNYMLEALLALWMLFIGLFYKPQQTTSDSVGSHSVVASQRSMDAAASERAVNDMDLRQQNLASSRDVRQRQKPSAVKVRKEESGNIHRLHDENSDSDDENATWNGNSTQQM